MFKLNSINEFCASSQTEGNNLCAAILVDDLRRFFVSLSSAETNFPQPNRYCIFESDYFFSEYLKANVDLLIHLENEKNSFPLFAPSIDAFEVCNFTITSGWSLEDGSHPQSPFKQSSSGQVKLTLIQVFAKKNHEPNSFPGLGFGIKITESFTASLFEELPGLALFRAPVTESFLKQQESLNTDSCYRFSFEKTLKWSRSTAHSFEGRKDEPLSTYDFLVFDKIELAEHLHSISNKVEKLLSNNEPVPWKQKNKMRCRMILSLQEFARQAMAVMVLRCFTREHPVTSSSSPPKDTRRLLGEWNYAAQRLVWCLEDDDPEMTESVWPVTETDHFIALIKG